jgi:hypothetical protein
MAIFNDELYSTGSMSFGSSTGLAKWTGSTWSSAAGFNESHSGIFVDGNDLYVGSDFASISKKTGTGSFTSLPELDDSNDNIFAINKYDGNIVIAGNFDAANAIVLNNIAYFDGTAWQALGDGLSGEVRCMTVYDGDLIVGGKFSQAGGNNAKFIAKWDGTNWSDVGGSVTGTGFNGIRDLRVHNNDLYVTGDFNAIGGVSGNYVAKWNGTAWTSMDLVTPSFYAASIELYNDELYVSTLDFDSTFVYKWDGPLGVEAAPIQDQKLSVFPNPSSDAITISSTGLSQGLTVFNSLGQTVYSNDQYENTVKLNVAYWESGIYIVEIKAENGETNRSKIIVR